jgi:xanthine dehydrogenase accessory factor
VLATLPVEEELRAAVHTPAGLDIGAHSAPEVALSILAEVVSTLTAHRAGGEHRHHHEAGAEGQDVLASVAAPPVARDPVCGMSVLAVESSVHADTSDGRVYFCGTGCRSAYLDNPAAYPT